MKLKIPNNFVVQYLRTILFCINNVKASCFYMNNKLYQQYNDDPPG